MDLLPAGSILDLTLDSMQVNTFWQSGRYVYWQTGIAMLAPPPESEGYEKDTHCSAFAAAAALRLGVPLLHPNPSPKMVREKHLANQQADWLHALPQGWQSVSGPVEAQKSANHGFFVVISYLNPNKAASGESESGHIQVVRAYTKRSENELESVGPQIIQAGQVNFNSATAQEGFATGYAPSYPSYPWPNNVKYYAHPTNLANGT